MFRFAQPHMLYLLVLIPLLLAGVVVMMILRRRRLERFGQPETLRELMPDVSPRRERYKIALYLCAVALVILALARPQMGSKLREVTREGVEMMLVVDVSNSMLAEDIKPSRLERTKYAIGRLLENLGQDRVGLVVFAGNAIVQLPVTGDYVTARNFVNQLSPDMLSSQGTAIGAALKMAAGAFSSQSEGARVIILITDGENHDDDALAVAENIAKQGIKIYAIGIGTPEGSPIPIGGDVLRDKDGKVVVSRLDEQLLQKIALGSGGAYIRATSTSLGLDEIVAKIKQTEQKRFATTMFEEYNEKFQYPLALALALLLVDTFMLSRKNKLMARFNIFR